MIPKLPAPTVAVLACMLLVLPAAAIAGPPTGGAAPPAGELAPIPLATPSSTSALGANGVTITVRTGAIVRRTLIVRGVASPGRSVAVQVLAPSTPWTTVATAEADSHGAFVIRWRAKHLGRYQVRAVPAAANTRAMAAADPPVVTITVYRPDVASWYGPGFYGQMTACGTVLTHRTLGVAHRTLPCGTPVAIMFNGRSIVVPVIDRGPYVHGVSFDLTRAAAKALGMTGTSPIGEVALTGRRVLP